MCMLRNERLVLITVNSPYYPAKTVSSPERIEQQLCYNNLWFLYYSWQHKYQVENIEGI